MTISGTIGAVVGTAATSSIKVQEKEKEDQQQRYLQEAGDIEITANYVIRFKYQLGLYCSTGPIPLIQATCGDEEGTSGTIQVLRTNHEDISCNMVEKINSEDNDPKNQIICETTCVDRVSCGDIFITTEYDDDVYGEIYISCTGSSRTSVQATVMMTQQGSSGDTTSVVSSPSCVESQSILFDHFQFYHLQLGIFCSDIGVDGTYDYQGQFFDCAETSSGAIIPIETDGTGKFTCIQGQSCDYAACEVEFEGVTMFTETQRIRDSCFTVTTGSSASSIGESVPVPNPTPPTIKSPPGDYSARYQTRWSQRVEDFWCGRDYPPPILLIECIGGGDLELLETYSDHVTCQQLDKGTIECTDKTCSNSGCSATVSTFTEFPDAADDEFGSLTFVSNLIEFCVCDAAIVF